MSSSPEGRCSDENINQKVCHSVLACACEKACIKQEWFPTASTGLCVVRTESSHHGGRDPSPNSPPGQLPRCSLPMRTKRKWQLSRCWISWLNLIKCTLLMLWPESMYKLRLLFSIIQKLWREITSNIWRPAPPCWWEEGGQTDSRCFVTTFFWAPGQAHLVEVFLLPTQLLPRTSLCQPVISFFPSVCRHPNAYFMFPKTFPFQNLMKNTLRPSLMFLDVSFGTDTERA